MAWISRDELDNMRTEIRMLKSELTKELIKNRKEKYDNRHTVTCYITYSDSYCPHCYAPCKQIDKACATCGKPINREDN